MTGTPAMILGHLAAGFPDAACAGNIFTVLFIHRFYLLHIFISMESIRV
jgi:hypothetical protein